jgi:hypothetical protein
VLVEPDGRRFAGSDAVFRLFLQAPGLRLVGALGLITGIRQVARVAYGLVARHRVGAARLDRWLLGHRRAVPSTTLVRWLFLRSLGLTFFAAFHSLGAQVLGLYGAEGIEPLAPLLNETRARRGRSVWKRFPSLLWLNASDERMLQLIEAGKNASVALTLNLAPRASMAVAWASYLSFVSVGGEFLSFQWDSLLLETAADAFIVTPGGLAPGIGRGRPPWTGTWLLRWLAFRLHFESGLAKIQSGDRTWRTATACRYYYETAPLPTQLGWRVHHLPPWVHRASTLATLALETAIPWLGLLTRRPRRWAFAKLAFLQAVLIGTGNYGFFNLLSLADLLWLLDDEDLWPSWAREQPPVMEPRRRRLLSAAASAGLMSLSGSLLLSRLTGRRLSRRMARAYGAVMPFHLVNPYGLFSVMTTSRPEIIVEGSNDGEAWRAYEFRYKPGDVTRAPRQILPHMPRFDWLMWFAAMETPPLWFVKFLVKLLEGSPDVLALLGRNPFPDHPPRYVRATLYQYRMTDLRTQRETGTWWSRERLGLYVPPLSFGRTETARPGPDTGYPQ